MCCLAPQAWQTVAAEYYDPAGHFNQVAWASQLLTVLKGHGGVLQTRADTYKALSELLASLGDKYSTFLDPSVSCRRRLDSISGFKQDSLGFARLGSAGRLWQRIMPMVASRVGLRFCPVKLSQPDIK